MKKFTHAWIAFKAIERLQKVQLTDENKVFADFLINWFSNHKDDVIRGAWYPDEVIVDNSTSHIMKYAPDPAGGLSTEFRVLPSKSLLYKEGKTSTLYKKVFTIDKKYNLPERCEALAHSVIDNLKIQQREDKGSALTPTDHHIALILFMLSHYIADAHMPLHCDDRPDNIGTFDLHGAIEQKWEEEVVGFYDIDRPNQRFRYDPSGFPLLVVGPGYASSILKSVEDELSAREFQIGYGQGNDNVREYTLAVSQFSYLLAYTYLPAGYDPAALDHDTLQLPTGQGMSFRGMSCIALADAVDAVARVWLRDLRRYMRWMQEVE